jgi:hypothetical protein
MKKTLTASILVFLILVALAVLAVTRFRHAHHERGMARDMFKVEHVSLVNLIANPDRFHGRWIRVQGVCNLAFEGNALYLSKEDRRHFVTKNAV